MFLCVCGWWEMGEGEREPAAEETLTSSHAHNRRMIAIGGAELLRKKSRRGESALHVACQAGDAETAALILDVCPELLQEPTEEWLYPLHHAAAGGEPACVLELLKRGARVDVQDDGACVD